MPLDRERHKGLAPVGARFAFAAKLQAVPLQVIEFLHAHSHFPIVFTTHGDRPVPVAVMSLEADDNRFVGADGTWASKTYLPAWLRRWPCFTAGTPDGRRVVCVDDTALGASEEPWFDAHAQPTLQWRPWERLLEEMEKAQPATDAFVDRLVALDLLRPFEAHAAPGVGEPKRLRGMQRVEESRLAALPDADIARLLRDGHLSRIHAHLFSLEHFRTLMDRV